MKSVKEQIEDINSKIEKLNIRLEKAKSKCEHEETYQEKSYFSGSYLDKASTTHYTYCSICKKLLNRSEEEHSWFG